MPWDGKKLPDSVASAAIAAAAAALDGAKATAYLTSVRGAIGSNYKRQLYRDDVLVWEATASGTIPIVGSQFVFPTAATQNSISAADIDTGEWVHYARHASDATKYIATRVTPVGGDGPMTLSGDLVAGGSVTIGEFALNAPAFDAVTLTNLSATAITQDSATLSVTVGGTIPVGSLMLLQWRPEGGALWYSSPNPVAVAGVFSHDVSGLAAGTTHIFRAFVYSEPGGGEPSVIHLQSQEQSFLTLSSGVGVLTLTQAYATAMSVPNDFPPGNAAGNPDWINSTWPRDTNFPSSPYGSNVDPMRTGQDEPGIGFTDAGYIVTRRAATGRIGDRFSLWQWLMSPKGYLNADGNWRVQIRDVQAALKIDSLTNPWISKFSGQIRTYGPNGANPLAISGNIADYMDGNRILLFSSTNVVDGRIEASGGVSFTNFTLSLSQYQLETNANDPLVMLSASETPTRVVAFAAVYWARIIADNPALPIPADLRLGAIHGVDFYDGTSRIGTPGQGRLVQLDTQWRPIVCAFVLQGPPPSQPMTPAQIAAWLPANPPPFV